jgi:hypothetical protein
MKEMCKITIPMLAWLFVVTTTPLPAQCKLTGFQSTSYFVGQCGKLTLQSNTGILVPAYGHCNGLRFESPFTPDPVITDVQNAEEDIYFEVFPNPATERLYFSVGGIREYIIVLNDLYGTAPRIQQGATSFETSSLPPGCYVVRLLSRSGRELFSKIIVKP